MLRCQLMRCLWVPIAFACLCIGCMCVLVGCAQSADDGDTSVQDAAQAEKAGDEGAGEADGAEGAQDPDGEGAGSMPAEQVESEAPSLSVEEAEEMVGISADGEGEDYTPGEVLVTFKADTPADEISQLLQQTPSVGDRMLTDESMVDATLEEGVLRAGMLDDPVVLVRTSEGATVVQAIAELQQSELVVDAQPNYIFELDGE